MKSSIIADQSFLGPYHHYSKLKLGDVQDMTFKHTNVGPLYLDNDKRKNIKYNKIIGVKKETLTKHEIIKQLKANKVKNPKSSRDKLKRLCRSNNTATKRSIIDIREGWINKPKGALQLLYERGWIDPGLSHKEYTWYGKKMSLETALRKNPSKD